MADLMTRSNDPERTTAHTGKPIGSVQSPARRSEWKDFFSNLNYFLTERRIKMEGGPPAVFVPERFGDGTGSNLKELFRAAPRGDLNSGLLVNWNSGFGSVWQNISRHIFLSEIAAAENHQPAGRREGNMVQEHPIHTGASLVHGISRCRAGADYPAARAGAIEPGNHKSKFAG